MSDIALLEQANDILVRRCSRLESELDAAKAWIREAKHLPMCAVVGGYEYPCDCGRDKLTGRAEG